MSEFNCNRRGCKDVFRAFLVKNATYDSKLEIPWLERESRKPERLIPFSKAIQSKQYEAWIHFYEDDIMFERVWNRPHRYLPILKRFQGVITPDFSLYRDMPLVMQYWNVYRRQAFGHWLQENGVVVVPNVRYGDERTFKIACAGIQKNGVIALGTHGCIKEYSNREYLEKGLAYVVRKLKPRTVIVYGTAPNEIFGKYKGRGIEILQFDSDIKKSRKAVKS